MKTLSKNWQLVLVIILALVILAQLQDIYCR
jgi:hypothetical protein